MYSLSLERDVNDEQKMVQEKKQVNNCLAFEIIYDRLIFRRRDKRQRNKVGK